MWFTNDAPARHLSIGRITLAGKVTTYTAAGLAATGSITKGPDSRLWFAEDAAIGRASTSLTKEPTRHRSRGQRFVGFNRRVVMNKLLGTAAGVLLAAPLLAAGWAGPAHATTAATPPTGTITLSNAQIQHPEGITRGPDGALWFTDQSTQFGAGRGWIGRMSATGKLTRYDGDQIHDPTSITTGPDGALWFTNSGSNTIGRITTHGNKTYFSGHGIAGPEGIVAGPNDAVWFVNRNSGTIGRVTMHGTVKRLVSRRYDAVTAVTAVAKGPHDTLWFTTSQDTFGKITAAGKLTLHHSKRLDLPLGITRGPHNTMWVTNEGFDTGRASVARINTAGHVSTVKGTTSSDAHPPSAITRGPHDTMWYVSTSEARDSIARVTAAGKVHHFTGAAITFVNAMVAGPHGDMWFTEPQNDLIGHITPNGKSANIGSDIAAPSDLVEGPDGAVWFTNYYSNSIGRITSTGKTEHFTAPSINGPSDITVGPDGAMWFTNDEGDSIGRITTTGGVTNFPEPVSSATDNVDGAGPMAITTGPDGALWIANRYGGPADRGTIDRLTTAGAFTEFDGTDLTTPNHQDSTVDLPDSIVTGPDGALWFANTSGGADAQGTIGRITTAGAITRFGVSSGTDYPASITTGPDGALWFVNLGGNSLGRVTTSGAFTTFQGNGIAAPQGIAAGPDGAMWFTNGPGPVIGTGSSIGRITVGGAVSRYGDPGLESPGAITPGPDGRMWFTDNAAIGRISTSLTS
jgi:streptogramin lyase